MLVVPLSIANRVIAKKVAGESIRFRRSMTIVQVRGNRLQSEASIVGWQIVEVTNQNWLSVTSNVGLSGNSAVKCPKSLEW